MPPPHSVEVLPPLHRLGKHQRTPTYFGREGELKKARLNDEDLDTDHIDAKKAFTQAEVDRVIHVEAPEGFTVDGLPPSTSKYVLLLKKALEGIKQGSAL